MHFACAPVPLQCGGAAFLHRGHYRTIILHCPAWARKSHRSGRVAPIRTSWVPGCLWEWAYPQYGLPFRTPLRSARDWFAPASMQPGMVTVAADRADNRYPVHGRSLAANHGATTRRSAQRRGNRSRGSVGNAQLVTGLATSGEAWLQAGAGRSWGTARPGRVSRMLPHPGFEFPDAFQNLCDRCPARNNRCLQVGDHRPHPSTERGRKTTWHSALVSGRLAGQLGTCTRSDVGLPVKVSSRTLIALVQAT